VSSVNVKICGITNVDDARACASAGAHALGINLIPTSVRAVSLEEARRIAEAARAVRQDVLIVAVVADLSVGAMVRLQSDFGCLQLHGNEAKEHLLPLLPHAYKAVRIASEADVELARSYPGEYLLADAKVSGMLGGTGQTFDWSLVRELARTRKLTLAGGLTPKNVRQAVEAVSPYAVDVASGVEESGDPRRKDWRKVEEFLANAYP
jgi:phosphoribosylanthranilate isomerase